MAFSPIGFTVFSIICQWLSFCKVGNK
jgi:hypothetical protein